ncbi:PepSY-associated TM helix domain-containing protein [Cellulomonas sp. S1-8]|uniref:PepSY-associated TM helix domain-containing protein n=1 Tax=Cellulomonas sp. S1-8 TaxID=2904790 RepID=UPI00224466E4|nr:PepSY domain-containing protein [Cellulomonas sp. S1-8]UZN03515.1 PepSY domain-containing protein [Cellulomonas sp. S1-8]
MTTTRTPARPDAGPPDDAARTSLWSALHPLLLRLHFYAGVLVGPFLLVAATTGLLYTTTPQLETVVHAQELVVDEVGTRPRALDEQLAAAREAHPEGRVTEIRPAATPDGTTRVVLAVDDVPEGRGRTVFVDPYTLEVRGALTTAGEWLPVRWYLDDLHRNLLLGEPGRVYSEIAASWLWVVVLAGVAMWVARSARRGRLRRLVVPETAARGRRRLLSWHGVVGLVVAVGLLGLSATGLTWSARAGANIGELRESLGWITAAVDTTIDEPTGGGGGHVHGAGEGAAADVPLSGVGSVHAVAQADGLRDPVRIVPPAGDGQAWTVAETTRSWPTQADTIAVDGATGEVVDRVDFADQHLAAKLTRWGIDAHMGLLFGVVNQLVLAALAIGLITLVVLGYRMWWARRPTRSPGFGPGPWLPPGGLRRAPRVLAVLVVGVAAVVGWFVPLLGVPLLGFLLVDVLLAVRARRRREVSRA